MPKASDYAWLDGTPCRKIIITSAGSSAYCTEVLFLKIGFTKYVLDLSPSDPSLAAIEKAIENDEDVSILACVSGTMRGGWCNRQPCSDCPRGTKHGPDSSEWAKLLISRVKAAEPT